MRSLSVAFLALFSLPAVAADTDADQAVLLAPTPPQVVADDTATPAASSRTFSLGMGTGVDTFGGNAGQIYGASSPVVEIRGEWAFSPMFSARAGFDFTNFQHNAAPNGAVSTTANSFQAATQCHFLSTARARTGFDPFVTVGAGHTWRSQVFLDHNTVEKDGAFRAGAGLGTNYYFQNAPLGVFVEANAAQVFYKDRASGEYLASGVADLTGLMYSARVGMKYVF